MNLVVNDHNVFLIVFVTFLVSVLLVPIVKKVAEHVGAMDVPNARKVHKKPMPRLGGLAIYIAFLFGYILYGQISTQMISILIGSFLLIIVGIFDDIKPVPAKWKLLAQTVGASIIPLYGGILLKDISAFGLYLNFGKYENQRAGLPFNIPFKKGYILNIVISTRIYNGHYGKGSIFNDFVEFKLTGGNATNKTFISFCIDEKIKDEATLECSIPFILKEEEIIDINSDIFKNIKEVIKKNKIAKVIYVGDTK